MLSYTHIKQLAARLGFDLCGTTRALPLVQNKGYLEQWIKSGYGDPIEYVARFADLRLDPSQIIENGQSVIVCAISYKSETSLAPHDGTTPRIASYALNRDYHKSLRKRLKALLRELTTLDPTLSGRCFTDSAPLLEKQLAVNSGLGWIGRQSLLINPQFGSFVLLGEIVVNKMIDHYDSPIENIGCGSCRRCIDICPTGAINNNLTIDARLCISCRTVEYEDNSSQELNGWIFGCDECQRCCPHNQRTPLHTNPDFDPISTPPSRAEWEIMTQEEFDNRFGSTPLKRAGLERIKRLLVK